MDYQARRRARELRLGDDELIVARCELDDLRDAVYVLARAVEDVDRDLADGPSSAEVRSGRCGELPAEIQACYVHDWPS